MRVCYSEMRKKKMIGKKIDFEPIKLKKHITIETILKIRRHFSNSRR
jgi:hypothetical protein